MNFPSPHRQPAVGHLGRWGREPLTLLDEGAALGPVFSLQLWRKAVVGYSPDWNRFVLGDLDTFRSKGSMSGLSPHLAAGVVQADGPAHNERRRELNPSFARQPISGQHETIAATVRRRLPAGDFDAVAWSAQVMRDVLSATFFGDAVPMSTLAAFLSPLDRPLPWPFLRRPLLFRRMNQALRDVAPTLAPQTLGSSFVGLTGGLDELRVALSAAYDTTAHTMAWLLHHVAAQPQLLEAELRAWAVEEVLRLYPAGWLGSRRCAHDTEFDGTPIAEGTLVMYSPYLTHHDPTLWKDPLTFRPQRFADPLPAWGFIPFAAGRRSCLGSSFARLILTTVLEEFATGGLTAMSGDPRPRAGITLAPAEPLWLRRQA